METILGLLVAAPFIFILLGLSILYNGWALQLLWSWFMVPIFGLPALSIAQAIAVAMIIGFVTYQYHESPKETKENGLVTAVFLLLFRPLVYLGFGLILRNFI